MIVINFLFKLFLQQFGDSQKLRLVRILRSTVMVRVGGGWVSLSDFLLKHDPCRGKNFTHRSKNIDGQDDCFFSFV